MNVRSEDKADIFQRYRFCQLLRFAAPQNLERYRTNNGQRAARRPNSSAANGPKQTPQSRITARSSIKAAIKRRAVPVKAPLSLASRPCFGVV
jgi:hypothetical protein